MNQLFCLLSLLSIVSFGHCLECNADQTKVTVLLEDPSEFDDNEQFLFAELVAYALRVECSNTDVAPGNCPSNIDSIVASDVILSDQTNRFAMCVEVTGFSVSFVQQSINKSFSRFTGGLSLSEDVLEIEGVPKSLEARPEPDFPTWLIPFLCIVGLLLIIAIVMVSYTVYQSKQPKELKEDQESLAGEKGNDNESMDPSTLL